MSSTFSTPPPAWCYLPKQTIYMSKNQDPKVLNRVGIHVFDLGVLAFCDTLPEMRHQRLLHSRSHLCIRMHAFVWVQRHAWSGACMCMCSCACSHMRACRRMRASASYASASYANEYVHNAVALTDPFHARPTPLTYMKYASNIYGIHLGESLGAGH